MTMEASMLAAQMAWPGAVVGAAFFLGLFWFLGRASSGGGHGANADAFWAYKTAKETSQPQLLTEMEAVREDVRALRAQVDDLHRMLQAVE